MHLLLSVEQFYYFYLTEKLNYMTFYFSLKIQINKVTKFRSN